MSLSNVQTALRASTQSVCPLAASLAFVHENRLLRASGAHAIAGRYSQIASLTSFARLFCSYRPGCQMSRQPCVQARSLSVHLTTLSSLKRPRPFTGTRSELFTQTPRYHPFSLQLLMCVNISASILSQLWESSLLCVTCTGRQCLLLFLSVQHCGSDVKFALPS